MGSKRELLFSVTAKDCDFTYSRGSGAGGQKRNKTETKVRCLHRDSGANATSDKTRDQRKNKVDAFCKMARSAKFLTWNRIEAARVTGETAKIEATVDRAMDPRNIRVEGKSNGLWVEIA